MEKNKEKVRHKGLLVFVLIVLLFFLLRLAIIYICAVFGEKRENEMLHLKMDTLMDIVAVGTAKRSAADANVSANLAANIKLMTSLLGELVTEDGYEGPRVFDSGFVAELQGESVILPEEYRGFAPAITRGMIEEGLSSGEVMTAHVTESSPQSGAGYADTLSRSSFLSFGRIAENWIYVDLISDYEYKAYLNRFSNNIYEALEAADGAFNGITLFIREQDGRMELLRQAGTGEAFADLDELGITEESIYAQSPTLTVGGKDYLAAYGALDDRRGVGEQLHIVQMLPQVSLKEQNVKRALLLDIVMVTLFAGAAVYVTAVQRYSQEHELTTEQAEHYAPGKMRKRMLNLGLLCVLLVFASALLTESVGRMYVEMRYGKDTLHIFSEHMEKASRDQRKEIIEEEEAWIVRYGEEMASLLSAYPQLNSSEKLQECCDILEIDYIMLFNPAGRQTLCSCDYSGFRLDDDKDEELYDFRRLLLGVPSIIHKSSVYPMTGLERQQIGVKMQVAGKPGQHGALLMALMPERTGRVFTALGDSFEDTLTVAHGTVVFSADSTGGGILYSSNKAMTDKTVAEYGLPESSLRDGYMDFTSIAGDDYLVITQREGERIYYYAVESGTMFSGDIQYGVIVSLLFAIVLALLQLFLLSGFNEESIRERAELRAHIDALHTKDGEKAPEESGKKPGLLRRLLDLVHWDDRLPGEKLGLILRVGALVLIVCALDVLYAKRLPNESYGTMLGFLMHGDWMRGLNLFSICSILLVISIAYPIYLAGSLLMKLSGNLLAGHGATICKLICSAIKYLTAFGVLYFTLEYLGFSTSTIIASLGVVSLAISLGAQDLIKDILAGLALVFDDCFRVGDCVKIGEVTGTVMEVGVRSTKLRIAGNNILFINNHEITDVLNLSKELTDIDLELKVSADESLLRLEEILDRELPAIGRKNKAILKGPYLQGVTGLSGCDCGAEVQLFSLCIGATVRQGDSYNVTLFLNRELRLLFEREGVQLM